MDDDVPRSSLNFTWTWKLIFRIFFIGQYVPTAKLHPKMMGRRSGVFKPPKAHILARDRHNNKHKEVKQEKTIKRLLKKHKKRSDMLKSLGIDLQMDKLVSVCCHFFFMHAYSFAWRILNSFCNSFV